MVFGDHIVYLAGSRYALDQRCVVNTLDLAVAATLLAREAPKIDVRLSSSARVCCAKRNIAVVDCGVLGISATRSGIDQPTRAEK